MNKIDNTSYKNQERIDRLEQNTAKLSDNIKLLEERENRRSLGARPKTLVSFNNEGSSDRNSMVTDRNLMESSIQRKNLSYSDQLAKGMDGLKSLNLMKELWMSVSRDRKLEEGGARKLDLNLDDGRSLDLFAEARKCIGLFPVKARHILDFNEEDYDISPVLRIYLNIQN